MAIKPRGWGLKALVAGPLRKELFCVASLAIFTEIELDPGMVISTICSTTTKLEVNKQTAPLER